MDGAHLTLIGVAALGWSVAAFLYLGVRTLVAENGRLAAALAEERCLRAGAWGMYREGTEAADELERVIEELEARLLARSEGTTP